MTVSMPAPPATAVARAAWAVRDTLTVARRSYSQLRRQPGELVGFLLFPIIMIVLFAYVFGSAISLPGSDFSDMTLRIAGLACMVVVSLVLTDWQPHNGVADTAAAFGLLVLFGFAMMWIGTFIGLSVSNPTVADQATFGWLFPLTFLANTFVPTQGLPTWLRPVADWNPMSATVSSMRHLFGNPSPAATHTAWPLAHPITMSLGWSLLLLAVFVPLAVWRYRRAAAH